MREDVGVSAAIANFQPTRRRAQAECGAVKSDDKLAGVERVNDLNSPVIPLIIEFPSRPKRIERRVSECQNARPVSSTIARWLHEAKDRCIYIGPRPIGQNPCHRGWRSRVTDDAIKHRYTGPSHRRSHHNRAKSIPGRMPRTSYSGSPLNAH